MMELASDLEYDSARTSPLSRAVDVAIHAMRTNGPNDGMSDHPQPSWSRRPASSLPRTASSDRCRPGIRRMRSIQLNTVALLVQAGLCSAAAFYAQSPRVSVARCGQPATVVCNEIAHGLGKVAGLPQKEKPAGT